MESPTLTCFVALFFLVECTAALSFFPTFTHFYSDYDSLKGILATTCSPIFTNYTTGQCDGLNSSSACKKTLAPLVTNCLLKNILPIDTANQAAAGVMLGLLPTVLSLVGPTTIETGMLALRRPILAQLIAASCPSISVIRTFDYRDGEEMLQVREAALPNDRNFVKSRATIFMVLQYLTLLGCIGNLVDVVWQLSRNTICTLSTQTAWLPLIWAILALPVHWMGFISVRMRVKLRSKRSETSSSHITERQPSAWATLLKNEFRLGIDQPRHSGEVQLRKEDWRFFVTAWIAATGSVLHVIFGTITLSSVLFATTTDGTSVTGRLLLSVLVSRAILAGELHGMRSSIIVSKDIAERWKCNFKKR